jgi:hypothetical protein
MLLALPGTAVIVPFSEIELHQAGVDRTRNKIAGDSCSPATTDKLRGYSEEQDRRPRVCYGTTRRFSGPVEDGAEIA